MSETNALITVVDDDESVRESLPDLLRASGFGAHAFASAEEFLSSSLVSATKCLVLDVAMPGMSGPDLHRELCLRQHNIPVVFITAHDCDALRDSLMKLGAAVCLHKPFDPATLIEALNAALPES